MTSQAVEERARRLETAVQGLLRQVEGLDEDRLYRAPGPGEWTVMQTLAHVAEMMPYWSWQARDVAGRERNNEPFGRTHEDPDRIGAVERHARDRLADVLPRLRDGLEEATRTMRELPDEGWGKTARHARRGEMTVEEILDLFLIEHAEEHASQVDKTLAGLK